MHKLPVLALILATLCTPAVAEDHFYTGQRLTGITSGMGYGCPTFAEAVRGNNLLADGLSVWADFMDRYCERLPEVTEATVEKFERIDYALYLCVRPKGQFFCSWVPRYQISQ